MMSPSVKRALMFGISLGSDSVSSRSIFTTNLICSSLVVKWWDADLAILEFDLCWMQKSFQS